MAFLVATTSLPAVYRPNGYARTTTAGTPHARANIAFVHEGQSNLCDLCSKSFIRKDHLRRHIKESHDICCKTCQKTFETKECLVQHMEIDHMVEKPKEKAFPCTICKKSFGFPADLRRHVADIHEHNGKHMCGFCEKRFYSSTDKKYHERTHTNEKPFECNICNAKFSLNKSRLQHNRAKHGGNQPVF